MRNLLVSISILFMISLCYGSPIRNRQLYPSEKLQTGKSEPIPPGRKVNLYQNETLIKYSSVISKAGQEKQDNDKQNYYVLVVTVPEATTARPPEPETVAPELPEPESSPLLINTDDTPAVPAVAKEETPSETAAAPVQEQRPPPSLINQIGNVLVHTIRGNFSGIVDESFGTGVAAPLVTVLNNLLSDSSCNTIRRLLGQCRTDGTEIRPAPPVEETRALLLNVIL